MFRGFFPESSYYRPSPFSSPFDEEEEPFGYHGYTSPSSSRRYQGLGRQRQLEEEQARQKRNYLLQKQREEEQRRNYLLQRQREEEELLQRQLLRRQNQLKNQERVQKNLPKQNFQGHQNLQRQKEEQLRLHQKQKEEQQRLAQKQKEEEQRRRKALFLRYSHAALIIQRAFRSHLEERSKAATIIQRAFQRHLQEKREASALILQRTFRNYLAMRETKRIISKLKILQQLEQQMQALRKEREHCVISTPVYERADSPLPNKQFLEFEDGILKLMIKLDGVMSEGSEIVRDKRKAIISRANQILLKLDLLKAGKKGMEVDESALGEPMEIQEDSEDSEDSEEMEEDDS